MGAPGQTQNAVIGSTVYFNYILTNTGNEDDSYNMATVNAAGANDDFDPSTIIIYRDDNCNGRVDAGDIALTGPNYNTGTVPEGDSVCIIVSYTIPSGLSNGDITKVDLQGTSVGDGTQSDTDNYNQTTVVSDGILTATKDASPDSIAAGDEITYTITGSNTGTANVTGVSITIDGSAETGIYLSDNIPEYATSGTQYVAGSLSGSPATGYSIYYDNSVPEWTATEPSAADVERVGYFIPGPLIPNQSFTMTFKVAVSSTHAAGTIPNEATVSYNNNAGAQTTTTNETQTQIGGQGQETVVVYIGTAANAEAQVGGDYNADEQRSGAAVEAGACYVFTNQVKNAGNATDIINITTTPPAGFTVTLYKSDGVTPLNDTNNDNVPDVGPLAAGAVTTIKVKVCVSANEAESASDFDTVVRAESSLDDTKFNLTHNIIEGVDDADFIFGNHDAADDPAAVDTATANENADPGDCVQFELDLVNQDANVYDTYDLTYAAPAGWTVTYFIDVNGNGVLDPAEMTPVTDTGSLAPGAEIKLLAVVCTLPTDTPGSNNVTFTATSNNNGESIDQLDTVTITDICGVEFAPPRSGQTVAGGTLTYDHQIHNLGNSAQNFDLSFTSPHGWTYTYLDASNNVITDTDSSGFPDVTVGAFGTVDIKVMVFVPSSAPVNTVDNVTLKAVASDDATCFSEVLDTTTVVGGNLLLNKGVTEVAGTAKPGDTLRYTVDYRNLGTASLISVVIYDSIPANTTYTTGTAGGGPGTVTIEYSDDGGATWQASDVGLTVTNIRWNIGTVTAGYDSATASPATTLQFDVTID